MLTEVTKYCEYICENNCEFAKVWNIPLIEANAIEGGSQWSSKS